MNPQRQHLKKIITEYSSQKNLTGKEASGIFETLMEDLEKKMGRGWIESVNLKDKETIRIISEQSKISAINYLKIEKIMDYLEKRLKNIT